MGNFETQRGGRETGPSRGRTDASGRTTDVHLVALSSEPTPNRNPHTPAIAPLPMSERGDSVPPRRAIPATQLPDPKDRPLNVRLPNQLSETHEPTDTQRRETAEQTEAEREFMRGQGESLKKVLTELGLDGVRVEQETERRDAAFFDTRMTFGYALDHEPSTTVAFASSATDLPVSTLFIAPTETSSGLLVDDATQQVFTDSFWVVEKETTGDTIIRHVIPTRPVPLDGITIATPDNQKDPALTALETKTLKEFNNITNNKQATKDILHDAGIEIPRGVIIPNFSDEQTSDAYYDFISNLIPGQQVVCKPNTGTFQGDLVTMGDINSVLFLDKVSYTIDEIIARGKTVLFEERIDPPPQPSLTALANEILDTRDPDNRNERLGSEDIDYNLHVFTTIGTDPQVIDTLVRFDFKDSSPITIEKSALAVRAADFRDSELVEQVQAAATYAVSTIYQHVQGEGAPDSLPYLVGVDVIPDKNGAVYVIGIQADYAAFNTLAKMYGRPIPSIAKVLIPAQIPFLQRRFDRRQPVEEATLRSLPADFDAEIIRYRAYCESGNYALAQQTLYRIVTENHDTSIGNLAEFGWLAERTEDYSLALRYVNSLIEKDPGNPEYQRYKATFERRFH